MLSQTQPAFINRYICRNCAYRSKSEFFIKSHIRTCYAKNFTWDRFSCASATLEEYKCEKCPFASLNVVDFNRHAKVTENGVYCCPGCLFQTHSNLILLKHQLTCGYSTTKLTKSSASEVFPCFLCDFIAYDSNYLMGHCDVKHKESEGHDWVKCTECDRLSKYQRKIKLDQLLQIPETLTKIYKCEDCPQVVHHSGAMTRHYLLHHPLLTKTKHYPWYKCHKCNIDVQFFSGLREHYLEHGIEEIACGLCNFKVFDGYRLALHCEFEHKVLEGVKWYKCDQCVLHRNQLTFQYFPQLRAKIEVKWLKCDQCCLRFRFIDTLKRHSLLHSQFLPKWLECEHCDYKTKYRQNLHIHRNFKHSLNKFQYLKCGQCNFKTKFQGRLKHHRFMHLSNNQIESLECQRCDFKTKHKKSLEIHQLIHKKLDVEDKSQKCDQCDFKTKYFENLQRHIKNRHMIDKMKYHKCSECKFKTKSRKYLEFHQKMQHNGFVNVKWFYCDYCNFKTAYKANLNVHFKNKHEK